MRSLKWHTPVGLWPLMMVQVLEEENKEHLPILIWKMKMKKGFFITSLSHYLLFVYFLILFKYLIIFSRNPIRRGWQATKDGIYFMFSMLSPSNIKHKIIEMQQMSIIELIIGFVKLFFYMFYYSGYSVSVVLK